jgi:two-component system chemotaxis response regulator CheY
MRLPSKPFSGKSYLIKVLRKNGMPDRTPDQQLTRGRTGGEVQPVVLLVDDDRTVRTLLTASLNALGCRILTAGNGEEALQLLYTKWPVGVVVTEAAMPVMGGLDLLRTVRQTDRFKTLPIIFCSSVGDEATKEKAFEYDCDHYLTKPVQPEFLFDQISNVLVSPQGRTVPPSTPFS